jgi:hypothetical protein
MKSDNIYPYLSLYFLTIKIAPSFIRDWEKYNKTYYFFLDKF